MEKFDRNADDMHWAARRSLVALQCAGLMLTQDKSLFNPQKIILSLGDHCVLTQ